MRLPVEYKILDSGVGYVKINSNYDDLGLIIKLFERALKVFQANGVPGIVIDMRQNSGGANLWAGWIPDGPGNTHGAARILQRKDRQFEPEGLREKVTAQREPVSF